MATEMKVVLYYVKDVDKAKALFTALFGAGPHVDSPYYVGFDVSGTEVGLVSDSYNQDSPGSIAFFDVKDLAATLITLQGEGARVVQEPTDVGAGLLVAKVSVADGYAIGLRQPPPIA